MSVGPQFGGCWRCLFWMCFGCVLLSEVGVLLCCLCLFIVCGLSGLFFLVLFVFVCCFAVWVSGFVSLLGVPG